MRGIQYDLLNRIFDNHKYLLAFVVMTAILMGVGLGVSVLTHRNVHLLAPAICALVVMTADTKLSQQLAEARLMHDIDSTLAVTTVMINGVGLFFLLALVPLSIVAFRDSIKNPRK